MGLTYPVMAKRQPGPALSMEAVLTNTANMPRGLAKSSVCMCVQGGVGGTPLQSLG